MPIKKYINTAEVAELTGLQQEDIRNLAKTNVLPSHKTRKGHYRFNVDTVEKYFDIVINDAEQNITPFTSTDKSSTPSHTDEVKYISGHTARKYLKCSKAEFESLIAQGIIKAHRDEYNRWKVSKASVIDYTKRPTLSNETRLITNESHYQEVIEKICSAKSSVKIMTANFKRFRLKPTGSQGGNYNDGTPFVKYLMAKAIQGVSIQIICSMPSSSFRDEWKEFYQQMNPELFEYMFCERNHAKVVIIDDRIAYVGSANVTPAGIGQGLFTPGNFEAGIISMNPEVVSSAKTLFSTIWGKAHCDKCHRADMCNAKNL